jgi:hypothetical protein
LGNDDEHILFTRKGKIEIKTGTYSLASNGLTIYKEVS